MRRPLLAVAVVTLMAVIGVSWEARWHYQTAWNGSLVRVNRLTQTVEGFDPDSGWMTLPRPKNPFSALARELDSTKSTP